MFAKIKSGANVGLDAVPVTVEVDIASYGLPSFSIVGLGDRAVEEAKERVRSAIKNSGAEFPARRITINLAPADLPKEGPAYDLPIAVGILLASGQIISNKKDSLNLDEFSMMGELALDGELRKTHGVLPLVLMARRIGLKRVIVPFSNAVEAAIIQDIEVYACKSLEQLVKFVLGQEIILPFPQTKLDIMADMVFEYDFSQIKGQEQVKRALEIAAAGGHNVLMKGSPGAGKTMLARAFPSLLPPLSFEEALEVTSLYSISGNLPVSEAVIIKRPFRTPHHTASYVGMIGGGNYVKPGEVSLAHRGTLFLDELPEFPRQVLEALRQPLEDKQVTISRASGSITFPAQFILIGAFNPCPCGYLGDKKKSCTCFPGQVSRYQKRLSGPLLDRFDIYLEVPALEVGKIVETRLSESSEFIRQRVTIARQKQQQRYQGKILTNSEMSNYQIKQFCKLNDESLNLLKQAISSLNLSARGYHRVLKLARTIADLAGVESLAIEHVAEALQYRTREESS